MPMTQDDRGRVYKPCLFNERGADREMCARISATPTARQSCASCSSPWRTKMGSVEIRSPVDVSTIREVLFADAAPIPPIEKKRKRAPAATGRSQKPRKEVKEKPPRVRKIRRWRDRTVAEVARTVWELTSKSYGLSVADVADVFGCNPGLVYRLQPLKKLHPEVFEMLDPMRSQSLSLAAIEKFLKVKNKAKQLELASRALAESMTAEEVEMLISQGS